MLQRAVEMDLLVRHLVRDQDYKYTKRFYIIFASANVAVEPTAPRAPNQNAFVERWIGSIKHECLNRSIAFGFGHLDYLVTSYVNHYEVARPHQRKSNKSLAGVWSDLDDPPDKEEQGARRESLAGVLRH